MTHCLFALGRLVMSHQIGEIRFQEIINTLFAPLWQPISWLSLVLLKYCQLRKYVQSMSPYFGCWTHFDKTLHKQDIRRYNKHKLFNRRTFQRHNHARKPAFSKWQICRDHPELNLCKWHNGGMVTSPVPFTTTAKTENSAEAPPTSEESIFVVRSSYAFLLLSIEAFSG